MWSLACDSYPWEWVHLLCATNSPIFVRLMLKYYSCIAMVPWSTGYHKDWLLKHYPAKFQDNPLISSWVMTIFSLACCFHPWYPISAIEIRFFMNFEDFPYPKYLFLCLEKKKRLSVCIVYCVKKVVLCTLYITFVSFGHPEHGLLSYFATGKMIFLSYLRSYLNLKFSENVHNNFCAQLYHYID